MTKVDIRIANNTVPTITKAGNVSGLDIIKLFRKISNDQVETHDHYRKIYGLIWQSDDLHSFAWYTSGRAPKPRDYKNPYTFRDKISLYDSEANMSWCFPISEYNKVKGLESELLAKKNKYATAQQANSVYRYSHPKVVFANLLPMIVQGKIIKYQVRVWAFNVAEPIVFGNEVLYSTDSFNAANNNECHNLGLWTFGSSNATVGTAAINIAHATEALAKRIGSYDVSLPVKGISNSLTEDSKGNYKIADQNTAMYIGTKFDHAFVNSRITSEHPKHAAILKLLEGKESTSPLEYLNVVHSEKCEPEEYVALGQVDKVFQPVCTFNEFIEKNKLDGKIPTYPSVESFLTTYA